MNREQIIQMARDAGSIDSEETILTVYAAIRAATKEEDAEICQFEHLSDPQDREDDAYDAAVNDCVAAIRASK